jgi:hypothetical protein
MMLPALRRGGYDWPLQQGHWIANLLSLKWQQVAGTAEQKGRSKAFSVRGLERCLVHADKVERSTLEGVVAGVNQGTL